MFECVTYRVVQLTTVPVCKLYVYIIVYSSLPVNLFLTIHIRVLTVCELIVKELSNYVYIIVHYIMPVNRFLYKLTIDKINETRHHS